MISHPDLTTFYQVNQNCGALYVGKNQSHTSTEELVEQVGYQVIYESTNQTILTYILVGARDERLPSGIHIWVLLSRSRTS